MSEKEPYYFEKPNATRPLTGMEKLGLHAYHMSMEYSGPNQSLQSELARDSFDQVLDDIAQGRPFSHPIKDEREKSYSEHDVNITGQEYVPQEGSFVIVSNHYNRGVHKGIAQGPVMAHAISQLLPDGNTRKFIPVIENEKRLVEKAQKNLRMDKAYSVLPDVATKSLRQSVETVVGPADRIASQVLFNTTVVFGMIPTNTHAREIPKVFKNGDVLILFPTGKDEFELHTVNPMAGKLGEMAGAKGVPLLPVGYWFNRKKSAYQVRIGAPFTLCRDKKNPESSQQNAHRIGMHIARLLPEVMRGEYRQDVADEIVNFGA